MIYVSVLKIQNTCPFEIIQWSDNFVTMYRHIHFEILLCEAYKVLFWPLI